jgi:hypothetical protein
LLLVPLLILLLVKKGNKANCKLLRGDQLSEILKKYNNHLKTNFDKILVNDKPVELTKTPAQVHLYNDQHTPYCLFHSSMFTSKCYVVDYSYPFNYSLVLWRGAPFVLLLYVLFFHISTHKEIYSYVIVIQTPSVEKKVIIVNNKENEERLQKRVSELELQVHSLQNRLAEEEHKVCEFFLLFSFL